MLPTLIRHPEDGTSAPGQHRRDRPKLAKRFGIGTVTLHTYLNSDGSLKEAGERLMVAGETG